VLAKDQDFQYNMDSHVWHAHAHSEQNIFSDWPVISPKSPGPTSGPGLGLRFYSG